MKQGYFTMTLVTKDETSRGVAKACLLSVADVRTILQVIVKTMKTKMTANGAYSDHEDKDEDDHKDDHDCKLKFQ